MLNVVASDIRILIMLFRYALKISLAFFDKVSFISFIYFINRYSCHKQALRIFAVQRVTRVKLLKAMRIFSVRFTTIVKFALQT